MPNAPRRPCSHAGCNALVASGRCEKHKQAEQRRYDDSRKDDPFHKIYSSARWRKLRYIKLSKTPLCERCFEPATDVHHKREIRDGGDVFDYDNLESLCHACHSSHGATSGKRWG
jgi:5-methylcytosine-specific restriction enzyme A